MQCWHNHTRQLLVVSCSDQVLLRSRFFYPTAVFLGRHVLDVNSLVQYQCLLVRLDDSLFSLVAYAEATLDEGDAFARVAFVCLHVKLGSQDLDAGSFRGDDERMLLVLGHREIAFAIDGDVAFFFPEVSIVSDAAS